MSDTNTGNKLNVYQKLGKIQSELKAPKNLYNSYGKYNYRNAEGILEALKPLLKENSCIVTIQDSIEHIGERVTENQGVKTSVPNCYLKAEVKFIDCETGEVVLTSAYAHECEHKGMRADQCTGTASSYARKYALNALFLLDDTTDSDSNAVAAMDNGNGGWNSSNSAPQNNYQGQYQPQNFQAQNQQPNFAGSENYGSPYPQNGYDGNTNWTQY